VKRAWPLLAGLAATASLAAAPVPPELRGKLSVEVSSCEPVRGAAARAVVLRVRAGYAALRAPEVHCAAFVPGSDDGLGWVRAAGLDGLEAEATRAVMTLVPADSAHTECRCVAGNAPVAQRCAPWEALEGGRCVDPDAADAATAPAAPPGDVVSAALEVSRALAPLRGAGGAAACEAPLAAQLAPLVAALVPEDRTVYVTSLWRLLDPIDQRAFARWARDCFATTRLVDAERGRELPAPQPAAEAPSAR
jgi:hypothetical protein